MKKYKSVIVGCGNRSRGHIDAYRHIDNAEVTACFAPNPEKRDRLAAEYRIKAYSDLNEMLTKEKPDLVHLVTWPSTRVELMTIISNHDIPACTVEKPIATGVEDWQKLCALEARTKTRFAVCHQFRWQKHLVKCQQALATGRLGALKFLDFSAGMNISGQGTHILNYAMSLNGNSPVKTVFGAASGQCEDKEHPAPQSTIGYLAFENGVRGLWTNGATALRVSDPDAIWKHVRVSGYADKGRVNYEEFAKWEIVSGDTSESGVADEKSQEQGNLEAQADFHKAMITWIERGTIPGTSLKQSLHEWKAVLALYASAIQKRPIEMVDFNPPEELFAQLVRFLSAE